MTFYYDIKISIEQIRSTKRNKIRRKQERTQIDNNNNNTNNNKKNNNNERGINRYIDIDRQIINLGLIKCK